LRLSAAVNPFPLMLTIGELSAPKRDKRKFMTSSPQKGRDRAIARALAYVENGTFEKDLARRVALRTESQKIPDSLPLLYRYLKEEIAPAFERMGFTTRIYDNPVKGKPPVLLATRIEDPSLPTVLGYGHGDVQPGLDEQWPKATGHGSSRMSAISSTAGALLTIKVNTP